MGEAVIRALLLGGVGLTDRCQGLMLAGVVLAFLIASAL
jgi:hypothetical protein